MRERWGKWLCQLGRHTWLTFYGRGSGILRKTYDLGVRVDGEIQCCGRFGCEAGRIVPSNRNLRPVLVDLKAAA